MTTAQQTEHTVTVSGKPIFYTEAGSGPVVVLLHGGGPGASGVSNYSRNIDALAASFRVIVPDMPGYGRSIKGIDQSDPFGYLADMIRGLLDALGIDTAHLIGNSYGGAAALRLALDTPHRVDKLVLMGPGGIGTTRGAPTAGLKSLMSYYGGDGPSREKLAHFIRTYLVYDGAAVPEELIDLRFAASIDPEVVADPPLRRPSGPLALRTLWRMDLTRDARLKSPADPDAGVVGARRQGQPPHRRADAAERHAQRRTGDDLAHRSLDAVGTGRAVQPSCHRIPLRCNGIHLMTASSVFGSVHLGYIVIETERFADWRRFGRDAIGMHCDETLPDVMRFRLDDNECRFLLQRGPAEDVAALGWQLDDHESFDTVLARVTRHGVPVTTGTAEEAALRGVERLVRFPGPNGLAQEIFTRPHVGTAPWTWRSGAGS